MSRRNFLQLFGASAAGLAACVRPPAQNLLPYSRQPPLLAPGLPQHYATSLTHGGYARGILVTCFEGRPVKVEGNPDHPASLGAAGVFELAEIDRLYDPDRARAFSKAGTFSATWALFQQEALARANTLGTDGGNGLGFLVEPSASPLLRDLRARLLQRFPRARFYAFDPIGSDNAASGARLALGQPLDAHLDFDKARVIVSLAADFLDMHPMALRYSRAFAAHRDPQKEMNRLYVCEPNFTPTGTLADHRLRLRPSEMPAMAWALLGELAALPAGASLAPLATLVSRAPAPPSVRRFARAAARDLAAHPGQALVVAGPGEPPEVHAIAHALNFVLGAFDSTVRFTRPLFDLPVGADSLRRLVDEMRAGTVSSLAILGVNPVYTAPADLDFATALRKVPHVVYHSLYEDETAPECEWFLPAAHPFEAWGDARAWDGTASLVQPLIAPLFDGVTEADVLASFLGESAAGTLPLLRRLWESSTVAAAAPVSFDQRWESWLSDGLVPGTASAPVTARVDASPLAGALRALPAPASARAIELRFEADRKVLDGRLANLARVQEMPDPISKLMWGNAAFLSPQTAKRLGVQNEDLLLIRRQGRSIQAPASIAPGHADECVTVALGYGRRAPSLHVALGIGFDANALRPTGEAWSTRDVEILRGSGTGGLIPAQSEMRLEKRPHAPVRSLDRFRNDPKALESLREPIATLYEPFPDSGHRWAMAIDLSRCTSCSACVLACVTENNIPPVGKKNSMNHRAMHWLRVDRYFHGPAENPTTVNQPMMCQHCRFAPCEYVCPVNATVHSDEGLNEQVYNRCVGTRYCSNNCPYKVRRFNFLNYNGNKPPTERMAMNPDVTVRGRGVMEKCTYCVQRIERARIAARSEGREIKPGEVVTACAQACPTEAIVFGDLADLASRVSQWQATRRSFAVLHEIGTRPRTHYLARVDNPNPELA